LLEKGIEPIRLYKDLEFRAREVKEYISETIL